jgi:hypothetical protein
VQNTVNIKNIFKDMVFAKAILANKNKNKLFQHYRLVIVTLM